MGVAATTATAPKLAPARPGVPGAVGAGLLLAVFCAVLLPISWSGWSYYNDEHLYTDAAIRMVQTGDCLTPYTAHGKVRLRKPVLAYWAIAASYRTFGINSFASRGPFLLAGAGALWMTYWLALTVFRSKQAGWLAAVLLGSNMTFVDAATRAHPDMLHCLFLTIAVAGVVCLVIQRRTTSWSYSAAYLGSGLAVATKGLLGLLVVPFAMLFCRGRRGRVLPARQMLNAKFLIAGLIVAGAWFVAVMWAHGLGAWQDFVRDQVTGKMEGQTFMAFGPVYYLLSALRHFLPWTAFLLVGGLLNRDGLAKFWREHRELVLLAASWLLLLCCIFGFSREIRSRYMLPSYSLLAVVMAGAFVKLLEHERVLSIVRWCGRGLLVLVGALGIVFCVIGARFAGLLGIGGVVLLVAATGLAIWMWRRRDVAVLIGPGLAVLVLLSVMSGPVTAVLGRMPAKQIAARLRVLPATGQPIGFLVHDMTGAAGQISVLLGGERELTMLPANSTEERRRQFPVLVCDESNRHLIPSDYHIEACGDGYRRVRTRLFWRLLVKSDEAAVLAGSRVTFYLAARRAD